MRHTLYPLAVAIALIVSLNSCAPSLNDPGVPNALLASPDSLHLRALSDTASSSIALRCGCTYQLAVVPASGDTTRILCRPAERLDSMLSAHTLRFYGATGTPTGSYSASFALSHFEGTGQGYLRDTIHVFLTMP